MLLRSRPNVYRFMAKPVVDALAAGRRLGATMEETRTLVCNRAPSDGPFRFRRGIDRSRLDTCDRFLEVIVSIGKLIAGKAESGPKGLQSMLPTGDFLTALNGRATNGASVYFALGSDFEPLPALNVGWNGWFSDRH